MPNPSDSLSPASIPNWELQLSLARQALQLQQPLVARSHFLRAILEDQSGDARREYAAFLRNSGDFAGSVAEYSRLLESAESRRDYPALQEISWLLVETYHAWNQQPQATYFLDYAIFLEAQLLVHHQVGLRLNSPSPNDFSRQRQEISDRLGQQLLNALSSGNAVQETILWITQGVFEWTGGKFASSLESLRHALTEARKLRHPRLVADSFLWIGRVCHTWEHPELSLLSLRRAACWGPPETHPRRRLEVYLRLPAPQENSEPENTAPDSTP